MLAAFEYNHIQNGLKNRIDETGKDGRRWDGQWARNLDLENTIIAASVYKKKFLANPVSDHAPSAR